MKSITKNLFIGLGVVAGAYLTRRFLTNSSKVKIKNLFASNTNKKGAQNKSEEDIYL